MGQTTELGDGAGALCPACSTWWPATMEAWWAHIVEEHPTTAERLGRIADGTPEAAAREEVRREAMREAMKASRLSARVRGRSAA